MHARKAVAPDSAAACGPSGEAKYAKRMQQLDVRAQRGVRDNGSAFAS